MKMMKKINALIMASLMLSGVSITFATESNQQLETQNSNEIPQQGTVQFIAEYDSNIIPQQGDIFVITYGIGDNQAQMEIDASLIASTTKQIEMPITTYTIYNIEAKNGTRNESIAYAVNNQFTVSNNGNAEIRICVGENSVNNIISLFGENNLLIKNYMPTPIIPSVEPSIEPSYEVPSLNAPSIEEPSINLEPSSTLVDYPSKDNMIVETPTNENQPSEKTEEEIALQKEKHRKSLINRGFMFLVLASISLIGLFVGHKMGKF